MEDTSLNLLKLLYLSGCLGSTAFLSLRPWPAFVTTLVAI